MAYFEISIQDGLPFFYINVLNKSFFKIQGFLLHNFYLTLFTRVFKVYSNKLLLPYSRNPMILQLKRNS